MSDGGRMAGMGQTVPNEEKQVEDKAENLKSEYGLSESPLQNVRSAISGTANQREFLEMLQQAFDEAGDRARLDIKRLTQGMSIHVGPASSFTPPTYIETPVLYDKKTKILHIDPSSENVKDRIVFVVSQELPRTFAEAGPVRKKKK